jgi:cytochrome oxidase assembly protein ShyY1
MIYLGGALAWIVLLVVMIGCWSLHRRHEKKRECDIITQMLDEQAGNEYRNAHGYN